MLNISRDPVEGSLHKAYSQTAASEGWGDSTISLTARSRTQLHFLIDMIALNVALVLAFGLFNPALGPVKAPTLSWGHALTIVISYTAWRLIAAMTEGLESHQLSVARPRPFDIPTSTIVVLGLSVAIGSIVSRLSTDIDLWALPRLSTVVFLGLILGRWVLSTTLPEHGVHGRLLVLGASRESIQMGAQMAGRNDYWGTAIRYLADDLGQTVSLASGIAELEDRPPKSGDYGDLARLVRENRVDTIVISEPDTRETSAVHTALACLGANIELISLPILYERVMERVSATQLNNNWMLAANVHTRSADKQRQIMKRTFDIVSASVGLILLAPFLPIVAAAIYLDSPGPVFYKQERVGRLGKRFFLYKLRTMVVDSEPDGPVWAEVHDPRITRVGRVLRKAHADEFPQLVNILRGDMSAVGPRPERPSFVEELSEIIPMFDLRHSVKPGMAGWGLIKQGYGSSTDDALLKLQYDLYYIENQSIALDVGIILRTITDGLTLRGR